MGMLSVDVSGVLDCSALPSKTHQSFKNECDINVLVARYEQTGLISHVNRRQPVYADVSELTDFQRCLEVVDSATSLFSSLSARVRDRFNNDPAAFLEFASDPANSAELRDLGLAEPLPVQSEPTARAGKDSAPSDAPPSQE